MNAQEKGLYDRIVSFEIDTGPVALSFAKRLAGENGWSKEYAQRVILEYKRFLFLAMKAGHPVTPSDQVDQAWHLHLSYTRSYWDRLCGEILNRPLHHDPTQGGEAENRKFDDWYARTLASYECFFGMPTPSDIWPPAAVRFGMDPQARRVNTIRNWIVPKAAAKGVVALLLLAILAVGSMGASTFDTGYAIVAAAFFFAAIVALIVLVRRKSGGGQGGHGGSCAAGCGGGDSHGGGESGCGAAGGCSGGCGGGGD